MEHISQVVINRLRVSGTVSKNKCYFCHIWKNNYRLFFSVTFNHIIWQRRKEVLLVGGEGWGGEGRGGGDSPVSVWVLSQLHPEIYIFFVGELTTPN